MARSYNHIYLSLVKNNGDIVGHIAYALYKADKIHFIENFKQANGSKDPDETDLIPFHSTTCCPGNIHRYRAVAASTLQNFVNETMEESLHDIEQDTINKHKQLLSDVIRPIMPPSRGRSYLHGIAQNLIAAVIFMFLIAGIIFAATLSEREYSISIGGKGNARISESSTIPPDSTTAGKPNLTYTE